MNEILEYAKDKVVVLIGDYKIEYKGIKEDTIEGKTESWVITKRNLPTFISGSDKEWNLKKQ